MGTAETERARSLRRDMGFLPILVTLRLKSQSRFILQRAQKKRVRQLNTCLQRFENNV